MIVDSIHWANGCHVQWLMLCCLLLWGSNLLVIEMCYCPVGLQIEGTLKSKAQSGHFGLNACIHNTFYYTKVSV